MKYIIVSFVLFVVLSLAGSQYNLNFNSLHYIIVSAAVSLITWFMEK